MKSRDVKPDEKLIVAADLLETGRSLAGCIGLAAPQIGHFINMILVNVKGGLVIMINPEVVATKGKFMYGLEGCFSRPETVDHPIRVKRWFKIKVRYEDLDGKQVTALYKGRDARVVQHEMDHLNGIVIGTKPKPVINLIDF